MEALEVTARRALQRLMRDILAAMVGSSLHTMRDPVALFARAAPTGILDASGFHQLVSTLEVSLPHSLSPPPSPPCLFLSLLASVHV